MFGEYVKNLRLEHNLTLRQFCINADLDPSLWSKVERGLANPPQTATTLRSIGKILGIKEGSAQWQEFQDLANITGGHLPPDIMDNRELMECLPLVFRTVRKERPTRQELLNLADLIRNNKQKGKRKP